MTLDLTDDEARALVAHLRQAPNMIPSRMRRGSTR
jgi:hypothetical protein